MKGDIMPKGVRKVVEAVEMTDQELDAAEGMQAQVKVVGSLEKPKLSTVELREREQANKLFPYTPCSKEGWIDMTFDEMAKYEKQGLLKGYDPIANIGLLKKQ